MRFNSGDDFSEVTLGQSYDKNYKFLFQGIKNIGNSGMCFFNSVPIFKYKKLILKYDRMPNQNQIKIDIQKFIDNVSSKDRFKIFNMNCRAAENREGLVEYMVNVTFINFNLK